MINKMLFLISSVYRHSVQALTSGRITAAHDNAASVCVMRPGDVTRGSRPAAQDWLALDAERDREPKPQDSRLSAFSLSSACKASTSCSRAGENM